MIMRRAGAGLNLLRVSWKVVPTGKETWEGSGSPYWVFVERIKDTFGDAPVSPREIHYEVTGPLGLSPEDTITLIKNALREGYLKYAKGV